MRPSLILFVVLSGSALSVFGQAPYLVKDLPNGSTGPRSSQPGAFLWSGGTLFFTATTETNGREPWVQDGNDARLLRDINAGETSSNVTGFMELTPGIVIFTANDGESGQQLWRSDGTEAGTTLLKIVNATTSSFSLSIAYGGKVFFMVDDGVHGREPWITDGTSAGTELLVDTRPGTPGTSASQFFRFGTTTRFLASGGIWTTDGTPAGTTLDVPLLSFAAPAAITSTSIFFFGFDSEHGFEPWKSDGTAAGTAMIKDVRAGPQRSATTVSITATASGAVFFADDGTGGGGRLWTTDGTAANTVQLGAFPASGTAYYALPLYPTSKGTFCSAGPNVWRTDGTQAGTYLAAAMGAGSGPAFSFVEAFSRVYFTSWTPSARGLFHTDGSQGATPVNVRPDIAVSDVAFTGGKLWFAGTDETNGSELWVSDDGTANGTHLVANLALDPARSSTPVNLTAAGPYLYFHPTSPKELWRSDGTSAGTIEVTDIDNTLGSPPPFASLTPYHGDLYYHRSHSEFHRLDGVTGEMTHIGNYNFDSMTADENYLYLWSYSGGVLRSDGTAAGTIQLYDLTDPDHLRFTYDSIQVITYGGFAWIKCYHGLFRTAGTLETTRRMASVPANSSLGGQFTAAGGLLYSVFYSPATGSELWRSDGTGSGSFMVKDANPGSASSNPTSFTAAGRLLFFVATDPDHGTELWRSDGTVAGTFMVKDIRPGTTSSGLSAFEANGDILYFAANDGVNGSELWKSDGTEAGTVLVRDIAPGPFSSEPSWLASADGKVWFSATDGFHGFELWSSDGTDEGTVMVGDIIPGSSSSAPDQLTAAEGTLFFTAATDQAGRELWALPLTTGSVSVTGARIVEGHTGTQTLRFTVSRHGASAAAATVAYATSDGTASAGSDYDSAQGTISFAAGETVQWVDVVIHGDTDTEASETLFLQLSSPAGFVIHTATAAGVIEDDDPLADLVAEVVQSAGSGSAEVSRTVKVTNNGPSSAYGVTVKFTESPYAFWVSTPSGVTCSNVLPMKCTLPYLQAGDSRTLTIYRQSVEGLVDPALPPGRTVTVTVSSDTTDTDLANNSTSRMTTGNGKLLVPSQLVIGTSAAATFDLGSNAAVATDVTLASSAASVIVTPPTLQIAAGQRTASFTLTTSAGLEKTLLTATIDSQSMAALVVPIVAVGQSPLLDVAIVASNYSSFDHGEPLSIPVRVAARYPDGTLPSGLVSLLDQDGITLSQLALDAGSAATFTHLEQTPGDHHYRIRYGGDAGFNPLTVSLPAITVEKAFASIKVHAPTVTCSNTVELRVVVSGPEGTPAPTGSVSLTRFPNTLGTLTLVPNGEPSQSEGAITVTLANGFHSIGVAYSGDGYFASDQVNGKYLRVGCTAMNFAATATSATTVALSWAAPAQTTNRYDVYRADSIQGEFLGIASTSQLSVVDTTAQPGRLYLYYVIASGAWNTPYYFSNVDIASTLAFTDNPLAAGMLVKSAHFTELRSMAMAMRELAGLSPANFTWSALPGTAVAAQHVIDMRNSIDAARARIGLPALNWVQPGASPGAAVRAATLQELRGAAN